jgi:hypothetical protein
LYESPSLIVIKKLPDDRRTIALSLKVHTDQAWFKDALGIDCLHSQLDVNAQVFRQAA